MVLWAQLADVIERSYSLAEGMAWSVSFLCRERKVQGICTGSGAFALHLPAGDRWRTYPPVWGPYPAFLRVYVSLDLPVPELHRTL